MAWVKHSELCDEKIGFGICPKCGRGVGQDFDPLDPNADSKYGMIEVE